MIKKEKIFELKIEEDDEISGIDSISLVDEPAIEIGWMAFNKEKEHEFHIPDGEDDAYLEMLVSKGEKESELLEEFEVESIEYLHKNSFVTPRPNDPSELDGREFKIRYKYVLNPEAGGNKVIKTTRQFCKTLVIEDLVWRVEDMEKTLNQFGQAAMVWRGGFNCRHVWAKIKYKSKNRVPKKAIDKREEGYDILGLDQPDTRTKNPSFSKEEMETHSDYPDSVKNNAKAVLKWVEENGWGSCGTSVGKQRANQLANGEPLSLDTVKRMYSYLSRHEVDLDSSKGYGDGCGKLMYDAWGGKSALSWAKSKLDDFGYDVGTIGGYVDPGINKKKRKTKKDGDKILRDKNFEVVVICDECEWEWEIEEGGEDPYICHKCGYDNSPVIPKSVAMSKQYFAQDNEKQMVLGPAMIPNQKIFRKDNQGNPYYVFFTPETIKMIAEKYMKNKYTDNNDQMHDGKAVKDVFVAESWIKESDNDKSTDYGFGELPVGTWFVTMKVNNPDIWRKVKKGVLNGFSVSGFFEEVAAFKREEIFLQKVAEILSNVKE